MSVSGQAAMVGSKGMQALINSSKPIYVVDISPVADATYHARFYFSPNNVTLPKAKPHDLFIGRSSSGTVIFRVQLQYTGSKYQVRGLILNAAGKTITTSWYDLSNSSHVIELAWQAASTAKGNDGLLSLWIDGLTQGNPQRRRQWQLPIGGCHAWTSVPLDRFLRNGVF